MVTIKKYLDFQGQSVILFADLDFDKETGVYIREWQVCENSTNSAVLSRLQLKDFDVRLLPADDLIELARELQQILSSNRDGFGAFAAHYRLVNQ